MKTEIKTVPDDKNGLTYFITFFAIKQRKSVDIQIPFHGLIASFITGGNQITATIQKKKGESYQLLGKAFVPDSSPTVYTGFVKPIPVKKNDVLRITLKRENGVKNEISAGLKLRLYLPPTTIKKAKGLVKC